MRKFVVALLITTGFVSVMPASAGAASPKHLERLVSGSFTGRQDFTFTTNGCSFVYQVFTLSNGERHHSADLTTQGCVTLDSGPVFTYSGTFTMSVGRGDTATGTAAGSTQGGSDGLHLVLTITSGTGQFRGIQGTLHLDGGWENDPGVLGTGPASGTVSAVLRGA
jgi:hypothetical protein